MSTKKSGNRAAWIALLVVAAGGLLGWQAGWFGGTAQVELLGATVERKQLVISNVQRGNLAAKDAVTVKSEIEGQTTILYLIEEGTFVEPGQLLVELDASELRDRRVAQEISVQNAEASYVKAKAQFEIQESQNKSDIETADRKLSFARLDLEKYLKGDWEQLKAQADEKIKLAEAELAKAQNTFEWSKSLAEKGFLTKTELDRDELDHQRAEVSLSQARRAKELLVAYDDPRTRTELQANVQEAERGLERARLEAQARLADFESALVTSKSRLDLEKEKLQKYVDQIAKARITATQPGMVVYARVDSGGRGGGSEPIQLGTTVRERQEILSIPRTSGLIVEASVHESVLKQVVVGRPCKIAVDALAGQQFDGRVQFVALLPDKGSWWANPNQRVYRTEIVVSNPHPDMRPGMSCSIEILSEVVPDALVVPLQCVFLDGSDTVAFVIDGQTSTKRTVKTGRSSQTLVQILEGLSAGERVLLSAPAGFTPKAAERPAVDAETLAPPAALAPAGDPAPGAAVPADDGSLRQRGERRGPPAGAQRGERGGSGAARRANGEGAAGSGGGAAQPAPAERAAPKDGG